MYLLAFLMGFAIGVPMGVFLALEYIKIQKEIRKRGGLKLWLTK